MAKKGKRKDESGNGFAKAITETPAYLAGGTMEALLQRINFTDEEGPVVPVAQGFHKALQEGTRALERGDMAHLEAMLYAQTETLNALFHLSLGKVQAAEYLSQVQLHSDIALKAQNHCRRTIAAIAELKQPKKATFIKQQNNAVNQQINSENNSQSENEVLESEYGNQLEPRAAQTAIGHDAGMETLDFGNRAKNRRREKARIKK